MLERDRISKIIPTIVLLICAVQLLWLGFTSHASYLVAHVVGGTVCLWEAGKLVWEIR